MAVVVTLHVFSGRPNPTWRLAEDQLDELFDRVDLIRTRTSVKPSGVLGRLGYRGFSIRGDEASPFGALSLYLHDGIVDRGQAEPGLLAGDRGLESWLLETAGERLDRGLRDYTTAAMEEEPFDFDDYWAERAVSCPGCQAADAAVYNPTRWNLPSVQPYNNCYNYANDQVTNTFAQPGKATDQPVTAMTCDGVEPSARADGLRPAASFKAPLAPGQGWYVALVVWPGFDFHWYRQDASGCWSHKPGQTAARDTDNSGHRIADPKTCDRGPYSDLCTYMVTDRGMRIR